MLLFSLYPSPPFRVAAGKQKSATPPTPALTLKHCSMALDQPDDNGEAPEFEYDNSKSLKLNSQSDEAEEILFRLSLPGVSSSLQRNCKQMILYIVSPNCMKNSAKSYQQFSAVPGLQNSNQLQ